MDKPTFLLNACSFNNFFINSVSYIISTIPSCKYDSKYYSSRANTLRTNNDFYFSHVSVDIVRSANMSLSIYANVLTYIIWTQIWLSLAVSHYVSEVLTYIIDSCFDVDYFPDELKYTKVIPIYSGGTIIVFFLEVLAWTR